MVRPRKTEQPYKAKADISVLMGEELPSTEPSMLPIDSISLPESQPRRYFDPVKTEQLIQSIKIHGILENLLVRPLPNQENQYELVAGERRYRAAIAAGLKEVPVTIRELTSEQALQLALVENLLREDLNPVEETEGILQLLAIRLSLPITDVPNLLYRMQHEAKGKVAQNVLGNEQGQAIMAVFEELGKLSWESFVSSRLPLLKLPVEILSALRAGRIAYTKAQLIARLKDQQQRQLLLEEAVAADLSVTEIRERVKALQPPIEKESPQATIQTVTRRITQSKVWENPKKWKQVQTLLKKLEALVTDENNFEQTNYKSE
ncbi:plasmid partitioning protein ParB [Nostoc linckia z18]|uniref:Plasmid partitioning protein ParB n=2 Tax=Nostoc linckia TaxID=92942 RepID=A0A9Q6EK83_NOSLI|nr:ParB/RepB/Spo0J family partition protein [Nostoc linckia]PHK40493.1 plasmid partitioning protein ParB [Nostoc linckia z15]PHK44382.1 plasmid partitioning protein ParB [Nostoc linckia z16]PHJ57157.1 plasmid partitioning protein ParB [Nostoc linckia z1]PHJ59661.1 plasmid partitioning protein ParB [Nostoc linckia z3]PHJ63961.1 plasmid partitioning protein ParB [Nostoc linckia z2]